MAPSARLRQAPPRLPPPRIAEAAAEPLQQLPCVASRRSRGWQPVARKLAKESPWPAPEDALTPLTPRLAPPRRVAEDSDVHLLRPHVPCLEEDARSASPGRLYAVSEALRRSPAAEPPNPFGLRQSGEVPLELQNRQELMAWAEALVQKVQDLEGDVLRLTSENEDLRRKLQEVPASSFGQAEVGLALSVRNVSFDGLQADADLLKAFKARLRKTIADDCVLNGQTGMRPDDVRLEMLVAEANSVRVEAAVSPPPGCSAGDLAGELHRSQTLARGIAIGIEGLGGLRAVLGGPVGIHRVSVSSRAGDDPRAVLERHQELQEAYSHLQQEFDALKASHGEEARRREDAESALEAHRDDLETRMQDVVEQKQRARLSFDATHSLKEGFAEIVHGLMAVVTELQEKYVAQTRQYEQLTKKARGEMSAHVRDMEAAESIVEDQGRFLQDVRAHMQAARHHGASATSELQRTHVEYASREREALELLDKNQEAAEQLRLHRQQVADLREQEAARLRAKDEEAQARAKRLRLHRTTLDNPNIVSFMALAMDGKMVRKVVGVKPNNNSQSLALRLLRLEVEQGVRGAPTKMWMRWCKEPYKDFQEKSQCDLQRVVALGFGYSSRAPLLFPNDATVVPERCFSVYNPRRSFDFVCASESDAEIFMLCLTRLCYRAQGWHVQGSVRSHSRFLSAVGWCKVQSSCKAKGKPLTSHILDTSGGRR